MGTREVPAPGGLGPRSQPVADATRMYGHSTSVPPGRPASALRRHLAARNGLALRTGERPGSRRPLPPGGGGAGGLQGPTPAANPPCGRWSLRQRSARADRTHVRGQQGPPPQQPGPSGSWVAEPAEVPPARQGRSQLVSVSGSPSSRASHRHRPTARTARGRSGENGTKAASRPRAMGMSEAGTGPGVACSCLHMYKHS